MPWSFCTKENTIDAVETQPDLIVNEYGSRQGTVQHSHASVALVTLIFAYLPINSMGIIWVYRQTCFR